MVRLEKPNRIWAEDGHVLVETIGGTTVIMTPEVAIGIADLLGSVGGQALMNRLREGEKPIRDRN